MSLEVRLTRDQAESWRWQIQDEDEIGPSGTSSSFIAAAVQAWHFVSTSGKAARCESRAHSSLTGETSTIRCDRPAGHEGSHYGTATHHVLPPHPVMW